MNWDSSRTFGEVKTQIFLLDICFYSGLHRTREWLVPAYYERFKRQLSSSMRMAVRGGRPSSRRPLRWLKCAPKTRPAFQCPGWLVHRPPLASWNKRKKKFHQRYLLTACGSWPATSVLDRNVATAQLICSIDSWRSGLRIELRGLNNTTTAVFKFRCEA